MRQQIFLCIAITLITTPVAIAQTVIVTDDPTYVTGQASAALDVNSIARGFLAPRMTQTQRTAITSPAEGLLVYQTDGTKGFYYFTNSAWTPLASGSSTQWTTTGSNIYYNTGNVGIGTTTPSTALHIVGTNPLTLTGVQVGATSDSILTITSGTVRKLPYSTVANGSSWSLTGNAGTNYATNFLGTTDNTSMRLRTNNTQRMILDSLGNIGIGTPTPTTPLHISASNGNLLYLQTLTGGTANIIFKTYTAAANPAAQIGVTDDGSYSAHITLSTKTPGADANPLAERVRISSAGNLGIGTTTPGQKLDVNGTIVSSATTYPNYTYNSANRMAFGEPNVPANETGSVVQYGSGSNSRNMLFAFTKTNVNTSYFGNDGTQMMLGSEAAIPITFRTGLVYASTNVMASGTEVMRLTSTGRLGIGTTAPATALQVVGTNPLTLTGVQTGATTDSLLTITAGTVRKLPYSTVTSGSSWSLTGNAGTSYATNFLGTTDNTSLRLRTNNTQGMILDSLGNVGIGTAPAFTTGIPQEKLLVDAGSTTTSFNAIVARGTINNYFQLNVQNRSNGGNASSDVVATADNGDELNNYVDLGINSSLNTQNIFGAANDAYLYNLGNNLLIGTGSPSKALVFMTGGTTQSTNERMRIDGSGNVGIGTTSPATALHVTGTNPLTLTGVQTGATTDSLLTITAGTVRKLPYSTVTSGSSWSLTGNTGTSFATNFMGTTDNTSLRFRTNNTQRVIMDSLGNVGIGTSAFDAANPEKLIVNAGTTLSVNAIYARGNINNYFQTNIQNSSAGNQASSDIVATANNGTESTDFVDLGINGSGYAYQNGNPIETGKANDGYLISAGNDFYIVNNNSSKDMLFLTGGTATTNERLRITSAGNLGIGKTAPAYKLDVKGKGNFDSTLNAPNYTSTFQTLTSGTITWDQTKGATATVTLTGNSTLSITNATAGMYGLLKVVQDGTGSRTLTLPSGSKVINGGGSAVTLTGTASAIDVLSYFYDGTNYYWTVGYNYGP